MSQQTNQSDNEDVFVVRTVFEKSYTAIDINGMTSLDLKALKTSDPFMYYSIPPEKRSQVENQVVLTEASARRLDGSSGKVTRKSRQSFESYPDDIWEELQADSSDRATEPTAF